jgi:hypothetical protein
MNTARQPENRPAELPPVHPNCQIVSGADIARYRDKLAAAGNSMALIQLGGALMSAIALSELSKIFNCRRN